MITCKTIGQHGRLGNQLFQIAVILALAKKFNDVAVLPHWNYAQYFKNPFIIMQLDHIACTYCEPHFHYKPIDCYTGSHLDVFGYFQSEKYFEHCKDYIKEQFEPLDSITQHLIEKYPQIHSCVCSIHIRRGDYINNPFHEVCNMDYYQRAIQFVSERAKIDHFFVFSDDPDWCRASFPEHYFIF